MSLKKLVVYVPTSHADVVRQAIGQAGGGQLGNYTFCSFSVPGAGRFLPGQGAKPAIGQAGKLEEVAEERIEVTCQADVVPVVVAAIKKVHPYEEIAMDIWALEE